MQQRLASLELPVKYLQLPAVLIGLIGIFISHMAFSHVIPSLFCLLEVRVRYMCVRTGL